jgi:hypothetical protein
MRAMPVEFVSVACQGSWIQACAFADGSALTVSFSLRVYNVADVIILLVVPFHSSMLTDAARTLSIFR